MKLVGLKNLCTPAVIYLSISLIALGIMAFQNVGNLDVYCVGQYSCSVSNTWLVFILKFFYIVVWTWILNMICSAGYSWISWLLVLFPFIVFFLLVLILMM